jgi:alpha-galactosidase
MLRTAAAVLVAAALSASMWHVVLALDNGLGATPPLAYSTWNFFQTDINETLIHQLADGLVSTGLAASGYRSLNIDAGYLIHERDAQGRLQVNR